MNQNIFLLFKGKKNWNKQYGTEGDSSLVDKIHPVVDLVMC